MDRGTPALIGWLGLASLALIGIITLLVVVASPTRPTTSAGGRSCG
jgi:hypothetical protein